MAFACQYISMGLSKIVLRPLPDVCAHEVATGRPVVLTCPKALAKGLLPTRLRAALVHKMSSKRFLWAVNSATSAFS